MVLFKNKQLILMQILLIIIILKHLNIRLIYEETQLLRLIMLLTESKKNTKIAVPLKYLSNFCTPLEMPLINLKVELNLKCSNYCVLSAFGNDNS